MLTVMDRGRLPGGARKRLQPLLSSKDRRVRQRALELLRTHEEIGSATAALASALSAKEPGTVATAASVLAAAPDRAGRGDKPSKALLAALESAFKRKWPRDAVETRAALVGAVGALGLLKLKPSLTALCSDANPTLRAAAEKALRQMGEPRRTCEKFSPMKSLGAVPPPPGNPVSLRVTFDSGVRTLTLDPTFAPITVSRLIELAQSKFYDGTVVHRVVPGFVVQFGDPHGDGYGGSGDVLPCETSPLRFPERAVGMALAGRDTGSSQLFVTLAPYPHLGGNYAEIGRAGSGWDTVAEGDLVKTIRVAPTR